MFHCYSSLVMPRADYVRPSVVLWSAGLTILSSSQTSGPQEGCTHFPQGRCREIRCNRRTDLRHCHSSSGGLIQGNFPPLMSNYLCSWQIPMRFRVAPHFAPTWTRRRWGFQLTVLSAELSADHHKAGDLQLERTTTQIFE